MKAKKVRPPVARPAHIRPTVMCHKLYTFMSVGIYFCNGGPYGRHYRLSTNYTAICVACPSTVVWCIQGILTVDGTLHTKLWPIEQENFCNNIVDVVVKFHQKGFKWVIVSNSASDINEKCIVARIIPMVVVTNSLRIDGSYINLNKTLTYA